MIASKRSSSRRSQPKTRKDKGKNEKQVHSICQVEVSQRVHIRRRRTRKTPKNEPSKFRRGPSHGKGLHFYSQKKVYLSG